MLKLGDKVKWVRHRFPELNKYAALSASGKRSDHRGTSYQYETSDRGCVGRIGEIVGIDETPTTKFEIETGEVAKYKIQFIDHSIRWNGKFLHAFEAELELYEGKLPEEPNLFEKEVVPEVEEKEEEEIALPTLL